MGCDLPVWCYNLILEEAWTASGDIIVAPQMATFTAHIFFYGGPFLFRFTTVTAGSNHGTTLCRPQI